MLGWQAHSLFFNGQLARSYWHPTHAGKTHCRSGNGNAVRFPMDKTQYEVTPPTTDAKSGGCWDEGGGGREGGLGGGPPLQRETERQ